ncbi:MAG: antitoxin [Pseudomonadota bacterium]
MRTTLDIADDVLFAAKELAKREKKTLGETISELVRRAFTMPMEYPIGADAVAAHTVSEKLATYGIHPLPHRGGIVTNEQIDRLRDEEGV